MEAFVCTAFGDESQWNALYFGIVHNCSAPILEALLFSDRVQTRLKPGPSAAQPYRNAEFMVFLRIIISKRLCLKYPHGRAELQYDFWSMTFVLPGTYKRLSIHTSETDKSQQLDVGAFNGRDSRSPYMFRIFSHIGSPELLISYGNEVYREFDWRYFDEILEERVDAIDAYLQ